MKKIWNSFFLACLLTWGTAAMAQSNASKDRPSPSGEKDKTVSREIKKETGPEVASELKTDASGRQYKMVDGRKVYTDSQGVQSLATPAPANTSKKEEVKTNMDPKK